MQPGAGFQALSLQLVVANLKLAKGFPGESENRRAVVEHGCTNLEVRFPEQNPVWCGLVFQRRGSGVASGDFPAFQVVAMAFVHHESGATVFHTIPQDATDHSGNVPHQAGRAEQPAGRKVADPAAQEPHETANVIGVAMGDENVGHLMRGPERHPTGISQIKQQAAGLVQKPELQQRVATHTVHQGGNHGADTDCHLRVVGNAGQRSQFNTDLDGTVTLLLAVHRLSRLLNYLVSAICAKPE